MRLNIPLHESSWYSSSVIQKERHALISIQHRRPGLLVSRLEMSYKITGILGNTFISYIKGVMTSLFYVIFCVSCTKQASRNLVFMTIFHFLSGLLNISSCFAAVPLGFLCILSLSL